MKRHDVDIELLTAGEYKRTLTVLGENTEAGREKFQSDLDATHALFKAYVAERRAKLDIETAATGEIWLGSRALEIGLVDALQTSDEYVSTRAAEGMAVFELSFRYRQSLRQRLGLSSEAENLWGKIRRLCFPV